MDLKNYDINNIFAKILRKEIPCKKIFEDDLVLAFFDAFPKHPVHALLITKKPYTCLSNFHETAKADEILHFYNAITKVVQKLELEQNGYRIICNEGPGGGQEIPHLHIHIIQYIIIIFIINI